MKAVVVAVALAGACLGVAGGPDRWGLGLSLTQDAYEDRTDLTARGAAVWELPAEGLSVELACAATYSPKEALPYTVEAEEGDFDEDLGSGKWNKFEAEGGLWWEPLRWARLGGGLAGVLVDGYDDDGEVFGALSLRFPVWEVGGAPLDLELSDRYYYSLSEGEPARNVAGWGLWLPTDGGWEVGLAHRHIDLVEGPDTDELSLSLRCGF